MRLEAALSRLDALVDWEKRSRSGNGFRMRVSVEPARDLCARLGHPERRYEAVHVAGSKGKGTVAALCAEALAGAGHRVGLYGSPHVENVHERIRIDGREIDDEGLATVLEAALAAREAALAAGSPGRDATWFDVLTAACFEAFARAEVAVAVVECGLGGRLDSTNVLAAPACAITNVHLEHTAILGDTRAAIAVEKAGIVPPGGTCVAGLLGEGDEVGAVLQERLDARGARLVRVVTMPDEALAARNRRVAHALLEAFAGARPAYARAVPALDRARGMLPGRAERRRCGEVEVWLDGAHVPASLDRLLEDLPALGAPSGFPVVVLGSGVEKDAQGLLKALRGRVDRVLCTSVGPGPYRGADELAALAAELGLASRAVLDPAAALEDAVKNAGTQGWVLVTGSLHLVGAVRGLTQPWTAVDPPRCSRSSRTSS